MSSAVAQKPDKRKMYGLLHAPDGTALERHVRILKVGFGIPSGPDVHVLITQDGKWKVEIPKYENGKPVTMAKEFDSRRDAERFYIESRRTAPERKYPRKLPYFTFLRIGMDGNYSHDFDAIEQHGPRPSELDVVFLTNDPLENAFQWWTAAELKCEGDGLCASRRVTEAKTAQDKKLAEEAIAAGLKTFPILAGHCYTGDCPFPKGDKPVCKPHGRLYFQLVNSPRIGGSCTYDTTGMRSISQLFSCIQQIKSMTGNGVAERGSIAGIPLKLVLRPYKTSHNGQPSVQYGVSLEFRAASAIDLMNGLHQHTAAFRQAARIDQPLAQIEGGEEEVYDPIEVESPTAEVGNPYQDEAQEAAMLDGEFYGDFDGEDAVVGEEAPVAPSIQEPQRKPKREQTQSSLIDDPIPAG